VYINYFFYGLLSRRPAGLRKKRGAAQGSEPAGPQWPDPHMPATRRPRARIKLKKKNFHLCILITFFYELLH